MVTEIVTQRRSNETPAGTLVTVLGCDGTAESGEAPRPGLQVRVVAVHSATSGPDWLGTF